MKVHLFTDNEKEKLLFEEQFENSIQVISENAVSTSKIDLLIVNANAGKNARSRRLGLHWLQKARYYHCTFAPVIVYSFENNETLAKEYPILNTKGVGFLQLPFSPQEAFDQIKKILDEKLTEDEIDADVARRADLLRKEWEKISHQIGGLMLDYECRHSEVKSLVEQWAKSINRFAPAQKANLAEFQNLLVSPSARASDLKQAKQKLDDGLKGKSSYFAGVPEIDLVNLPKFPPKGFSRVLIADDQPLNFLINDLQNEYRYTVVGQAFGAAEAERLLNEKKPDVVLSDYYFKNSSFDATTDKDFGERFMRLALKTTVGSVDQPKNPMVAVISKVSLDKLDIPPGVVDFSGANATEA